MSDVDVYDLLWRSGFEIRFSKRGERGDNKETQRGERVKIRDPGNNWGYNSSADTHRKRRTKLLLFSLAASCISLPSLMSV